MRLLSQDMTDHDLAAWMDDLLTRTELRVLMEHKVIDHQGDDAVFQNTRRPNLAREHPTIQRFDMNTGTHTYAGLSAVPLLNAVFCAGCETISNSPHDVCSICGSRSLINLFRMLDGTLRVHMPQPAKDHLKTTKYNVELTVKVHEIPANELNRTIESISRLAEVCGDLESLHLNVEPVGGIQDVLKVA